MLMCHAYLTVVFRNMHVQVSIQTLKDAADGACIAVLDRNDVDNEWRKVFLVRSKAEPAHFKLNNEKGELLDEPEEGCPKGIVADADEDHSIFAEWGMYYKSPGLMDGLVKLHVHASA